MPLIDVSFQQISHVLIQHFTSFAISNIYRHVAAERWLAQSAIIKNIISRGKKERLRPILVLYSWKEEVQGNCSLQKELEHYCQAPTEEPLDPSLEPWPIFLDRAQYLPQMTAGVFFIIRNFNSKFPWYYNLRENVEERKLKYKLTWNTLKEDSPTWGS